MKINGVLVALLAFALAGSGWACEEGCAGQVADKDKKEGCGQAQAGGCAGQVADTDKKEGCGQAQAGGCAGQVADKDKKEGCGQAQAGGCAGQVADTDKKEGCGQAQAGGCGEAKENCDGPCAGQKVAFLVPYTGLECESQKLEMIRALVVAGAPVKDFSFCDQGAKLVFGEGPRVSLATLEGALEKAGLGLDRAAFILPTNTHVKLEGMSCGNCANKVTTVLKGHESLASVSVAVGSADLTFAKPVSLTQLEELFAASFKYKIVGIEFGPQAPAAPTSAPALGADKSGAANEKTADGKYICPVTGNAIATPNDKFLVTVGDRSFYVCCPGCVGTLKVRLSQR